MAEQQTPAISPPSDDTGAETGHRFAFQDSWAAIMACALLDLTSSIAELYCEHHEDILIKSANEKYCGIQVKTRQLNGAPWKAGDEDVITALRRFAQLDNQFPGQFDRFQFATNHFFFETSKNGSNLPYMLETARDTASLDAATRALKKLIASVAKTTELNPEQVLSTLQKTSCNATLPKLANVQTVLRETIVQVYPPAGEAVPAIIAQAAKVMLSTIREASSLQHRDALPAYLSVLRDANAIEIGKKIAAKLFTADRVRSLLAESIRATSLLVTGDGSPKISSGEARTRLAKKLEAGGLSVVSINSAKDLHASAIHRILEFKDRFGETEALRRYQHLRAVVQKECAAAHEDTKSTKNLFGRKMQVTLRSRLSEKIVKDNSDLFDCREDHLEGIAYELTDGCRVWWSLPFDIKED